MKITKTHIIKYYRLLTDMSSFKYVKEYCIKGDKPLKAIPTYFDSLWCKLRYGMTTKEYFLFDFYNKSGYARRTYVSGAESSWTIENIIDAGNKYPFGQKFNVYQAFKPFYRREAIKLTLPDECNELAAFAHKYSGFILKPLSMSQGRGICIWSQNMDDAENVLTEMCKSSKGEVIVEELIQQDESMASFHPSSINTIRYTVDYQDGYVDKIYAMIRIGAGDSQVDNTSAGGICAAIDLDTGIIISKGFRRDGKQYIYHPDSGKQIIGTKIPKWDELNETIEKIRPKDTSVHFIGWDMALSKDGWCIVEGNWNPAIIGVQASSGIGYRSALIRARKNARKTWKFGNK